VAQRLDGAVEADLDRAFDAGEIVRTHVLRPTWHFVAPEDLRWLLALTAPRIHRASAFQYRLLEIDAALAARSRQVIERALRGGISLTREELGTRLGEAGIEATGPRLGYLVSHAELEGVVCSGPRRGKRHTYALVDERLAPASPRERDSALAELARRYVEGHGPAQVADLAWWAGLTVADARAALESASPPLVRDQAGGRAFWLSPTSATARERLQSKLVQLIPNYDELLVGFRDRSDASDPKLPAELRVAQVILGHVVVRNGHVVGRYRRRDEPGARATALDVSLAVPLDSEERAALRGAAERFAKFLGREVTTTGVD
jgi:winged helix DNA-binding protein